MSLWLDVFTPGGLLLSILWQTRSHLRFGSARTMHEGFMLSLRACQYL